jgi:peptide methionine sulfoxide reductase msrA/msrB
MRIAAACILVALAAIGLLAFGPNPVDSSDKVIEKKPVPESAKSAVFAGGCFWCVESDFEKLPGVIDAISGFAGGKEKNPTYKQVAYGMTSHTESVKVIYDPGKVTYQQLLESFWRHIDPTDPDGQFVDQGKQYRPAIFYETKDQKEAAEASKEALSESGRFEKPIVVAIVALDGFFPAEEFHQDFYKKDPKHYKRYRRGSGRDAFIKKHWK